MNEPSEGTQSESEERLREPGEIFGAFGKAIRRRNRRRTLRQVGVYLVIVLYGVLMAQIKDSSSYLAARGTMQVWLAAAVLGFPVLIAIGVWFDNQDD